ncbi:MAG: hypothetical protein ACPG77_13945 [Nannocystaceae bacterium]
MDLLDRITVRLRDAPAGLHAAGGPADPGALDQSGLEPEVAALWASYDGLNLAQSEVVILDLASQAAASEEARESGRIGPQDHVIAERGRDLLVLCPDPFLEGADVVSVEEDGERLPHSSTVLHFVLAMLGEIAVLYDGDGEFNEDLFGDDGELRPDAERKLLRRHLDFDADAPLARFRLAQSLARGGEYRGAQSELRRVLKLAPGFAWAHHELGRLEVRGGKKKAAYNRFLRAAAALCERADRELRATELDATGQALYAYFRAWACLACDDPETRKQLANEVLELHAGFASIQEARIRDAVTNEDAEVAKELLELGLAVLPGHLGLLSLRPAVADLVEFGEQIIKPRASESL